jgi:transposase-like protein
MSDLPGLLTFYDTYGTEDACWNRLRTARWGQDGFTCPACQETEHWGFIQTRKLFQCHACGKQTSVTSGTILQDTKLDLVTWFLAAYLVYTTKKGLSSYDLARKLEVSQTTAYYLQQKLCHAISEQRGRHLFGLVEADEAYIGPKGTTDGRGTEKETILGMVENRGKHAGQLRLRHVPSAHKANLQPPIPEHVEPGATVRTDGWKGYHELEAEGVEHEVIIQGDPKNAMEILPWAHIVFGNLKRVIGGTHAKVSDRVLQAYLDLFAYRFDHRGFLGRGVERGLDSLASSKPVRWVDLQARDVPWAG